MKPQSPFQLLAALLSVAPSGAPPIEESNGEVQQVSTSTPQYAS